MGMGLLRIDLLCRKNAYRYYDESTIINVENISENFNLTNKLHDEVYFTFPNT